MGAKILLTGVMAAVIMLVGCRANSSAEPETAIPFSCYRFGEALWEEFRFGKDSPMAVSKKAADLWGIDERLVRTGYLQEQLLVEWNDILSEFAYYSAAFEDVKLLSISVIWESHQPTLARVIECLGEPDFYDSFYFPEEEGTRVNLHFWYESKGLIVGSSLLHGVEYEPAGFAPGDLMDHMVVAAPGEARQMVPIVYGVGDDAEGKAFKNCLLRPWPGAVEEIRTRPLLAIYSCEEAVQNN